MKTHVFQRNPSVTHTQIHNTQNRIVCGDPLLSLSEVLHALFELLCHRQCRLSRVFRVRLCKFAVVQA